MISYAHTILENANWKRSTVIGGIAGIAATLPFSASLAAITGVAASFAALTGGATFWHQRNLQAQTSKLLPNNQRVSAAFVKALPFHERNEFIKLLDKATFPPDHRETAARILQGVAPEIRSGLIDQLLSLNVTPAERSSALRSLSQIPPEDRAVLINLLKAHLPPNFSPEIALHTLAQMTSNQRMTILARLPTILAWLPHPDEHQQFYYINQFFRFLDLLPDYEEKIEFLNQCEALIQPNMPDAQRTWLFRLLREAGDRNERQNFCRQITAFGPQAKSPEFLAQFRQLDRANRWQTATNAFRLNALFLRSENPNDLASLLHFSSKIPPAEMEQFILHARKMISIWTPKAARITILDELSKLSPAERRSAPSLVSNWMSSETRIELLQNLRNHPRLQTVQNHISFYMGGARRMQILLELRDRAVVQRREDGLINRISSFVHRWLQRPAPPLPIAALAPIREDSWTPQILHNNFQVNLPYLKAYPLNVASSLPFVRMQMERLPAIQHTGNDEGRVAHVGVDAGGMTRDFISQLFASLFNDAQPGRRLPTQPFEKGHCPFLNGTAQEKQTLASVYQGIGWIYALAIQGHCNITTGIHVHQGFFDMIHLLEATDFGILPDSIVSIDSLDPKVYNKLLKLHLKSSSWRDLFGERNADPVEIDRAIDEFVENGTLNDYLRHQGYENKNGVLEATQSNEIILAALNTAQSMYATLEDRGWNQMKTENAQQLNAKIQGQLTKASVLQAFGLQVPDRRVVPGVNRQPSTERNATDQEKWIQQYINELDESAPEDIVKLKKLVWAISGSSSVVPTTQLCLDSLGPSANFPAFHTCFNRIDIPKYSNYATFKAKLELSLVNAEAGNFGLV